MNLPLAGQDSPLGSVITLPIIHDQTEIFRR
jgi:hypothetical protein